MEFPWLSREAPTAREAIADVEDRVIEMIAGMAAGGEKLPPSLNQWVVHKLSGRRQPTALDDW